MAQLASIHAVLPASIWRVGSCASNNAEIGCAMSMRAAMFIVLSKAAE
jgi:hypothetical protein